jgi:hypothetical protein
MAILVICTLTFACGGRPVDDSFYDQGIADSTEPGVCDTVEDLLARDGDPEAVRNSLMLVALSSIAESEPNRPIPSQQELGRYADGVMEGCGISVGGDG